MYLWPNMILKLLIAIVPVAVIAWVLSSADAYEGTVAQVFWIAAAIYLIYWAVRIFLIWYRYHNDFWVITSQRLVDVFKPNPFRLKVATADLVNVQDMSVERRGILETTFDYGDIDCQTAGSQQTFCLGGIPNPREVQAIVDRERDRERLGPSSRPGTAAV
jgi:hypothetical protein